MVRPAWVSETIEPLSDMLEAGDLDERVAAAAQAALTLILRGREVDLTAKEFELLLYFARHPGRVYSRDELLDQVLADGVGGDGVRVLRADHDRRDSFGFAFGVVLDSHLRFAVGA